MTNTTNTTAAKHYAKRDPEAQGTHYENHVYAMTTEGLHAKSAIAAELAHRDIEIERLRVALASPAQAGEYPPLVCDYCGALTPDPWHSSGMLHGKMSKHIHSCDVCAARGSAKAAPAEAENEIDLFVEVGLCERLDACLAAARAAQEGK